MTTGRDVVQQKTAVYLLLPFLSLFVVVEAEQFLLCDFESLNPCPDRGVCYLDKAQFSRESHRILKSFSVFRIFLNFTVNLGEGRHIVKWWPRNSRVRAAHLRPYIVSSCFILFHSRPIYARTSSFIWFHLVSSCFILFHLVSSCFISFHLGPICARTLAFHLVSSRFISFHLVSSVSSGGKTGPST